jgi:hypothetical protein
MFNAFVALLMFYGFWCSVVLLCAAIVSWRNRRTEKSQEPTPPPNHPAYPTRRLLPSVEPITRVKQYQAVKLDQWRDEHSIVAFPEIGDDYLHLMAYEKRHRA